MKVPKDSFPFKVGHFECLAISDGTFPVPGAQPGQSFGQYEMQPGQIMEVTGLFIRTPEHAVLIDTGWGVGVEPDAGKLLQNLQAAGIQRTEIDTVILSHGHPDHIGGNTDAEGRLVFPNARYIMSQEEWEFLTANPDLTQLNIEESGRQTILASVQKNLIPIQDRLDLVDRDREILSGIELIKAPGHSPGHIVLVISSDTEQLLCTGDLFRQPLELTQPDLYISSDFAPEQAIRTRNQIIQRIIASNMLVFACHFPFPGLGHIVPKGEAWLWQPIET